MGVLETHMYQIQYYIHVWLARLDCCVYMTFHQAMSVCSAVMLLGSVVCLVLETHMYQIQYYIHVWLARLDCCVYMTFHQAMSVCSAVMLLGSLVCLVCWKPICIRFNITYTYGWRDWTAVS